MSLDQCGEEGGSRDGHNYHKPVMVLDMTTVVWCMSLDQCGEEGDTQLHVLERAMSFLYGAVLWCSPMAWFT